MVLALALLPLLALMAADSPSPTSKTTRLLEAFGTVEVAGKSATQWKAAKQGQTLQPGDRLRTLATSRATVQLSDRSILRIRERSLVVIEAPKPGKTGGFQILRGALFFLNRERPNQIDFRTPLASGAIRGTEFLVRVDEATGTTDLAVYQGEVALTGETESLSVVTGEQVRLAPGLKAQKTAIIEATNLIQWALYYPIFLTPTELQLPTDQISAYTESLTHYRQGNLVAARESLPDTAQERPQQAYDLAILLSAGAVERVEQALPTVSLRPEIQRAFQTLIAAVQFETVPELPPTDSPSEWIARSYYFQSQSEIGAALQAAQQAVHILSAAESSDAAFGPAWIRLAELQFASGRIRPAEDALEKGLALSPVQANAKSLLGYLALENHDPGTAQDFFQQAIQLDGSLGQAWLGQGIALMQLNQAESGRAALQAAAALEPQRSLFRSYLGKAFGSLGEDALAVKEFAIAKTLDPSDPTPDFYAGLHAFQQNRINQAIGHLENSIRLNDNRSVHRSRALLDRDLAIRSADLSVLYADAGLRDVSDFLATQSVLHDPQNFSGHLFVANSLQQRERTLSADRRFESARSSELLMANLLAPLGSGNLSQLLTQQDHLQYFETRPFALNVRTDYLGSKSWENRFSGFGTVDRLSYAIDGLHLEQTGQRPQQGNHLRSASVQTKYHLSPQDSLYLQIGTRRESGDDLRRLYNPDTASPTFRFESDQPANLFLGYHREWSPTSRTIVLGARLEDELRITDTNPNVLFAPQNAAGFRSLETAPGFDLNLDSTYTLYSAEAQHLLSWGTHQLIVGARVQSGDVDQTSLLSRDLTGIVDRHLSHPDMTRANGYAYYSWKPIERLRLIGGLTYDYLDYPLNTDLAPLTDTTHSRSLWAPKIGLTFEPWDRGELRAAYTQSLGGLYFDNSVRLEPSLLAGFNQSYRSVLPEGVAGIVPGSRFETWHASFNQSLPGGTYFGLQVDSLQSDGERELGALTNGTPLPLPDTPIGLAQRLDYTERSLSLYAHQLVGNEWAPGLRYRISRAELNDQFPAVPTGTPGLAGLSQASDATLQELNLFVYYNHDSGFFGRWESNWYQQDNEAASGFSDTQFWQHNLYLGYRFPRRRAQLQFGLLNLFDSDYRLNPINIHADLPRRTTVSFSARFNF